MKANVCVLALALLALPVSALARKPCEELKAEIEAKIRNNGVPKFSLEIVPAGEVDDYMAKNGGKVVGSCDGGTKRIVYKRG